MQTKRKFGLEEGGSHVPDPRDLSLFSLRRSRTYSQAIN